MKPDPDKLATRARALYLDASRQLDPATAARLRAARRRALEAARPAPRLQRLLLPAGAFAVIVLATLMLFQPSRPAVTPVPHAVATAPAADPDNDLPPDADSADPQLYQNLDFYGWLAATDRAHAPR